MISTWSKGEAKVKVRQKKISNRMFIYHFSRLIKSKLLWGMLALLMVFAFVVADSCSGQSSDATVGKFGGSSDAAVTQATALDAEYVLTALSNPQAMQTIPNKGYRFVGGMIQPVAVTAAGENMTAFWMTVLRTPEANEEAEAKAREKYFWSLLAAREVGQRNGFTLSRAGAQDALMAVFTTEEAGFRPELYGAFLANAGVQAEPKAFEAAYANVWVPAQRAVATVFNATGWVSPMERTFAHSAMYDKTTAQVAVLKNTLDPSAVTVTDEEIQAWYDAHLEDYAVPEQREITYVEIPTTSFIESAVVTDDDAMQYYEEHPEQFKGTNTTDTLPFLEAKDKAIAEMKKIKALENALFFAQTELPEKVAAQGMDALKATYGELKTATVREDRPFGFQNARDVIEGAFQTDMESIRYNAIAGTDRIYFLELKQIIPAHTAALADVRGRVIDEARRDLLAKKLETNGETIRAQLVAALEQGKSFADAVAACGIADFKASETVEFVANERPQLTIPHANQAMMTAAALAVGAVSKPEVINEEVLFTYVAARVPSESLTLKDELIAVAKDEAYSLSLLHAKEWLDWNLVRDEPLTVTGVPILHLTVADDEE